MTVRHTPGRRDLYKSATAALTGLAAFGSLAGTGYAAGAIAHRQELDQQKEDAAPTATPAPPAPAPETILKRRPHRTVVHTEVVHRVSTSVTTPGSGGTITSSATTGSGGTYSSSSSSSSGSSGSSGSSSGGSRPAPRPPGPPAQAAPAPSAPKPAPAPSSGS